MRAAERLLLSVTKWASLRCLSDLFSFFNVAFSALSFNNKFLTTTGNVVNVSSGSMAKKSSSILSSSVTGGGGVEVVESEAVEAAVWSATGSRTTSCWMLRAALSCGTREQQNVSSVTQSVHTELGQSPSLLQASEGLSLMVYEHTQQYKAPGYPVCPAHRIFLWI